MAIDISDSYVVKHTRGASQFRLRAVIALSPLVKTYRGTLRWLNRGKRYEGAADCRISEGLDNSAGHFQEHRWALVENFFADDFYRELVTQWPNRYEFDPPETLTKSYDMGMAWGRRGTAEPPKSIARYSALVKLRSYLRSPECSRRFSRFFGGTVSLQCTSFLMHMTREGSQVVPHRDNHYVAKRPALNMLMFVNGQGGENGGGLAISTDNELKDVIVEARNLKNAALLYDVNADFFHGFKPLEKGKFRWSMSAKFKHIQIRS